MNYYNLLLHYKEDLEGVSLIDEAIATLEQSFQYMDTDTLIHRCRPLVIAYLALKEIKNGDEKMETKYYKNGKLKDKLIVSALRDAALMYENGEIVEVRDILLDIADSIDEFERFTEENG